MTAHVSHLRPKYKDHVESFDLMVARTADEKNQNTHPY